jgi:acyl carrier protein
MKKAEFIHILTKDLEIESCKLNEDTNLKDLPEFTSIAVLGIIAIADTYFDKKLKINDIRNISTVRSYIELIGLKHFEDEQ